nr:hypothetical protein [Mycoplasmopsis bovis]
MSTQTIIQRRTFLKIKKRQGKGSKITYFTLLYTKEPIYHRPYQGNTNILRTLENPHGKIVLKRL